MLDQKKNKGEPLPYLANVNVRWGSFYLDDLRTMRFEPSEMERYGLRYGDIVMCEGGEPGRCAIWKENGSNMMIQKALHRIRPHDCLDYRFLFYYFLDRGRKGGFGALFTGSTIKHLPKQNLAKVEIAFPILSTQKRIAHLLSAYDDLIDNNQRRIQLLEQAARLLYKEWFVLLRFPGHQHVTITDGVPENWERTVVPDLITINPKEKATKGIPIRYFPMSALSTRGMTVDLNDAESRTKSTSVRFRNGDTLLARITPSLENGKTGFVNFLRENEVACGSTEFIVLRGLRVSPYFTYCLARTHEFRGIAIKSMIGSSGRQRVQPSCFDDFIVPLAPSLLRDEFDRTCQPIFEQISVLESQVQALTQARDILLPRLMSGELEV
jgi:type I restriction enzyme S subunit